MLKSTLLLATALFLITAPAPDPADFAEATHGLIADTGAATLQAAEVWRPCPGHPDEAPSSATGTADDCAGQTAIP